MDYSTTFDVLLEYRFSKAKAQDHTVRDGKEMAKVAYNTHQPVGHSRWLEGLAVRAGVRNIFDDPPPFANNVAGYPVPLEDPRQRFFFFDIEKKF